MDSILQPLRAYEHWLAQYKRVWRGTIGTSLVNPLLYLAALGVGLGTIVDLAECAGRRSLPRLHRAWLARRGRDAARRDRIELAGDGRDQVDTDLLRDDGDATAERDLLIGHQLFVVTRVFIASAAYSVIVAAFGAVKLVVGLLAIPVAVLIGPAFSMPIAAYAATTGPSGASRRSSAS